MTFTGFGECRGGVGATGVAFSLAVDLVAIEELNALVFGRIPSEDSRVETAAVGQVKVLGGIWLCCP